MNHSQAASESSSRPTRPTLVVREPGRHAILSGHPWLRKNSLNDLPPEATEEGAADEVVLADREGSRLGRGLLNPKSQIAVRVYTQESGTCLDEAFWAERLERAVNLRRQLGVLRPDGACRLVFSEADQLSGLVVDQYANHVVISLTAQVMWRRQAVFAEWFRTRFQDFPLESILVRTDPNMLQQEGMPTYAEVVHGQAPAQPIAFREGELSFEVDLLAGQKTGFYLDQRDNRAAFARVARGRVLDICCYTGGFAMAAAKNPAVTRLTAVDSSLPALEQAERHAALNQITGIDFVKSDCFDYLNHLQSTGEKFDTIILDPPKFAGRQRDVTPALNAYQRLNRLAMGVLAPGGFLMTCSCSGRVLPEEFAQAVTMAGRRAKRSVQVVQFSGAAADHPVLLSCPETQYLKCLTCRVL